MCCSGCTPGNEIWNWSILRTLRYQAQYRASEHEILRHEYLLACQAWNAYSSRRPDSADSPHFELGFRDGFAGYLHTGHLTPPSPPETYRWFQDDGPSGQSSAEAWLAGYRVGALEAARSGHRESLLVPVATTHGWTPEAAFHASAPELAPEAIPTPMTAETVVPNAPLPGGGVSARPTPEGEEPRLLLEPEHNR